METKFIKKFVIQPSTGLKLKRKSNITLLFHVKHISVYFSYQKFKFVPLGYCTVIGNGLKVPIAIEGFSLLIYLFIFYV